MATLLGSLLFMVLVVGSLVGWALREDRRRRAAGSDARLDEGVLR
jgi:hypothetical protein